jgi:hypothetical protein
MAEREMTPDERERFERYQLQHQEVDAGRRANQLGNDTRADHDSCRRWQF